MDNNYLVDIQHERLSFFTPAGEVKALNDVSIHLKEGEVLGIVGESGSGKSVTAYSLMGLTAYPGKLIGGELHFNGHEVEKMTEKDFSKMRGKEVSIIFQDPLTSLNPVYTIGNQIMEVIRLHTDADKKKAYARAVELLSLVGINEPEKRMKQYPHELSGGMRQRVMIAIALACEPKLLIADEPTTALDVTIQAQVLDMVGVENAVVVEDVSNKGGGNVISLEHLYNFDPDVILFADGSIYDTVTDPDGKPVEYTFFRPQQYGEKYLIKEWPSFNAMLEGYYAEKDRAERLRTKSKELHKAVHNMYERAVRKQAARQEELAASGKSEKLRLYGELLSANLYLAQKGMKSITVPNWYDEGKEVTIPLDLRFTPSQNAQNFFKNYKKKQTAARMLVDLLAEGEKEIAYLETVLYEVETASGEAALNEIRAELKSQGYLKYYKQRDKRQKPADFLRFVSSDGFEILVGRNNAQNDKLTLHTARGKDLWFHVQKAPGSHVVVMSRGEDIPDTTKQEAAELAVLYSSTFKAGTGAKVAVDTTEVKNIWKANGAKPGMVLYEVYTTVYVTPREDLAEMLKQKT